MTLVRPEALVRLIEIELVNQFERFIRKNLAQSPKTCRFNSLISTPGGGTIRICKCPAVNTLSKRILTAVVQVSGKPCTTLSHAKKCPVYQHYSGVPTEHVTSALIDEFFIRLQDPAKRATSFKTLHTLWLLLHESDVYNIGLLTRIHLKILSIFYKHKYCNYMVKITPAADAEWNKLTQSFMFVLSNKHLGA